MKIVYNFIIYAYILAIRISSLYNKKARLWIKGRKNIFYKLKEKLKGEKDIVWFHCASLGEFEQAKPVIKAYKLKYVNHKILLTFFSPSGFEILKIKSMVDWVFYLPSDTKLNAKKFISITKPIKAILLNMNFGLII